MTFWKSRLSLMEIISILWLTFSVFTAQISWTTQSDVMKNPDEAPDSGYIAIVTIIVATLLVLVLTVVSLFGVWKVFYSVLSARLKKLSIFYFGSRYWLLSVVYKQYQNNFAVNSNQNVFAFSITACCIRLPTLRTQKPNVH